MKEGSKLDRLTNRKLKRKKRKENRKIGANRSFINFLRITLGVYLQRKFNVYGEDYSVFENLPRPYFVMSTHNCFWGPFFVAKFVPHPVSFVVSDANFRNPLMKLGLALVGSIPKTKVISDMDTIKNILDIKRRGGVIGLYPEGQNSYDGHSLPIFYSTAKLIKRMGIPVVIADKRGSYLTFPRWAKGRRKGKVLLSYKIGFTPEDLHALSVEEIHERLSSLLTYNEFDFQRKAMIPFKGNDRAEYLEIVLFICPHCRSLAVLSSKGNDFTCGDCGYSVHYNEYGFFETSEPKLYFDNIRDWNVWQLDVLRTKMDTWLSISSDQAFLEDEGMDLSVGYKADPLEKTGTGKMQLFQDHLLFHDSDGDALSFPFKHVIGINMHNDEKMEFYFQDSLFRFDSKNKRTSLYKWYQTIRLLQEQKEKSAAV